MPPDPQTLARDREGHRRPLVHRQGRRALDQVYERLGLQVATEKRKLEVTNLFAGGALGLMVLSALSSIRFLGRLL